ncbi:MAG: 30S ribosome-binding factor RbfA [Clostridiales bacterium]|nr:30S ribosome-binding factor RbfA [Clostridiales bacterium]
MRRNQNHRGEKLGEEIRRIISELLARELKDPAFDGMISISYVKSTDDGSFATVYFTSLGADDADVMAGFEKAKGFIKNEIVRKLGIRRSPDLRFVVDETERYGQHIDTILYGLDLPEGPTGRAVTFAELPDIINGYERYLVFTHVHMDGDTFGAAVAFAEAMREIGRDAWVVTGEPPQRTLELINAPYVVDAETAARLAKKGAGEDEAPPYLAVAMDFSDTERLGEREVLFREADGSLSIDHHSVSKPACDFNYTEPDAAATSEIVYKLLLLAGLPVTERIATALYVGIVTDTGRFQYTNTTPETHRIVASLLEAGADQGEAYRCIYQSVKAEKLFVQSAMLNTLDIFAGGRAAMAFVRAETLDLLGAGEDETDGMSEVLRGIIGVEVSVFLKELPDGRIKASMRSKDWLDVAELAAEFGGGGHARAAGFTSALTIEGICAELKDRLKAALDGSR